MKVRSIKKKNFLSSSIGTKLTIIFLIMVIIPMLFVAFFSLFNTRTIIIQVSEEDLIEISNSNSKLINQLLVENQRTSATLAGDPLVVEFLNSSEEVRQNMTLQINQTLQNFADTHPDYDAPGLLDINGIVVASLEPSLIGKNRSFRDYFQASIQGESYMSDILVGRGTGRPGVFLTNPVINANNTIIGIDIIWLKADTIWDMIDEVKVGKEGIAFLIDQDGVIIAHPNRDLLYHSLGELSQESVDIINDTVRFGVIENTTISLIPESLGMDDLASELKGSSNSSTYRYYNPLDNRYNIIGYSRLESQTWVVVIDLPEDQYFASLRFLELMIWLSVIIIGIITLSIAVLLVHAIVRPIRRLSDVAISVEKGKQFNPLSIEDITSKYDEIAQLARVFSSMVTSLQQEIVERKKVENELKRSNIELERFAYVASHDLQEPLRMVASFTQLLADRYKDKLDDEANQFIDFAVDGALRMRELIDDLLSYSRLMSKEKEFHMVNCETILKVVKSNLENIFTESNAIITQDSMPVVYGDQIQLGRLFQNLIDNAIKFRREETPKIHIGVKEKKDNWEFFVSDNGIGIDSKYFDRIFVIFQRLHTKKEYKGTGIGLAVCKKIVSHHGGKIWIKSEIGKGTTIYFTILKNNGKKL
jgi:signal transduction histidine kinase